MPTSTPTNRLPADSQEQISGNGNIPKLDDRFIMDIKGKEFVQYAGLLDLAHQHGLNKIEVEYVQLPTKENGNMAICKAIATSKDGQTFTDIGDATPNNVNPRIAPHIIRMASTRAKARCLRDMCNIGITCLDELKDEEDVITGNGNGRKRASPKAPGNGSNGSKDKAQAKESQTKQSDSKSSEKTGKADSKANADNNGNGNGNANSNDGPRMSEAQKRAISNLAKRRGLSEDELVKLAQDSYSMALEDLTPKDAASFIRTLQQSA